MKTLLIVFPMFLNIATDGEFLHPPACLTKFTPHFYRILLIHPFPKFMERQMVDSAPILKPSYLLFGNHFLPPHIAFR